MNISQARLYIKEELDGGEAADIIEFVTGFSRREQLMYRDKSLSREELSRVNEIISKRRRGFPLQYILGKWTFMGEEYYVGEGVLIPRDDTRVVVQSVISYLEKKENPIIIDLCSGSGIIPITLKRLFPKSEVHALELSQDAVPYLKKNIERLSQDISLHQGDLNTLHNKFPDKAFDLIISNPPYIKTSLLSELQPEVRYEPVTALDGGADGMDFYRSILDKWGRKLKPGGMLALELDGDEFEPVRKMMTEKHYKNITGYVDIGGVYRAINGIAALK